MFIDTLKKLNIDPAMYLALVKMIASKQGYDPASLNFSKNPKKKLEYAGRDFGASGYKDFILYKLLSPDVADKKRKAYRARATKKAEETNDKYSPASLSLNILW
jgi:hypothetical protein